MPKAGLTLDTREVLPPIGQTVHYKRSRQRTGPPRKMRIPRVAIHHRCKFVNHDIVQ